MLHDSNPSEITVVMTQHGELAFPAADEVIGKSMQLYGEWAGLELAALAHFISAGDTVLDVGGCYGTHAIAFADMVGIEGRVLTFEASEKNFSILRHNVEAYPRSQIIEPRLTIVSSSEDDLFDLQENDTNSGASKLVCARSDDADKHRNGISLDSLALTHVDFIKIDVEGMEDHVLKGAQKLLRNFTPIIFFKVNTIAGALATISTFQGHDYQFFGSATRAYNPKNPFNNTKNVFSHAMECGIFAIPTHRATQITIAKSNLNLPLIKCADDIALLLLHKPQYFKEVLPITSAAEALEAPDGVIYKNELLDFKSDKADLQRMLEVERGRIRVLLDRLESVAGLMRKPITTSLQRNLAKTILKNVPWLSENRRIKLQRSVIKREYRQLFDVREIFEKDTFAPRSEVISKAYPGTCVDFGKIAPPVAPSKADWDNLAISGGIVAPDPVIDVIVPVYRAFDETMRCLYSVISEVQQTPFRLLVINDCSPDKALTQALRQLADRDWIVLIENEINLGFVITCNRGMRINEQRDVLLLNSDTEVYSNWLDRIIARANEDDSVGSLTPFSNNATICSYPHFVQDNDQALELNGREIDAIASRVCASAEMIALPTAVGFCMYLRRSALNDVGFFDEKKFGKGYGEENDLSQRLITAGWKNMLIPDVYVRHWGAVSFGSGSNGRKAKANKTIDALHPSYRNEVSEFVSTDPLLSLRARLDIGRLKLRARDGATLFVTHSLGGGTEKHIQDMRKWIEANSQISVLICRPHPTAPGRFYIEDMEAGPTPNLPLASWIDGTDSLEQFFTAFGITQIHVHHLIGHDRSAPRALRNLAQSRQFKVVFTVHDYFSICPRVNLVDGSGIYCGEPDAATCQKCIDVNGSHTNENVDIHRWREDHLGLINAAHTVYVPSNDVQTRLKKYTTRKDILVREHATDPILHSALVEPLEHISKSSSSAVRKIAVLGAISPNKGADLLFRTAKAASNLGLTMEFVVIGYTSKDKAFRSLKNVRISGRYDANRVIEAIRDVQPDFIWIPSVWPETFCFTLSEAISAGVQPIAFDLGAQAERIRQIGWGTIMPLNLMDDPDGAAQFLASCERQQLTDGARKSLIRIYPDLAAYYAADLSE